MTYRFVPLGEVAEVQGGIQKQPKRAPRHNAFPFLRVANVTSNGLDLDEIHDVELFDGELERYQLRRGDLLVVEGNGSASQIGRAAVWDGSIPHAVHQNHLIRVRPGDAIEPRYLGLVWNSPKIRDELSAVSSSTSGLHTLSVAKLKRVQVPLPGLDEQRRIIAILEDHLSRLDAAGAYLDAAARRTAVLHEQLLEAELRKVTIERIPLRDVLAIGLSNGKSVPTQEGGFPVLRLTALRNGRVDLAERKRGAWSAKEAERFLVARGDFLISRGNGSLRLVGRGGLVEDAPDAVAFPDTLIRARPDPDRIDARYLALVWNASGVRRQIERAAKTTAGIYKVNQKDLGAVEVPICSLADQAMVVAAVKNSREGLGKLIQETERARGRATGLGQALLAAAFSGKLSDGVGSPAEEALQRV